MRKLIVLSIYAAILAGCGDQHSSQGGSSGAASLEDVNTTPIVGALSPTPSPQPSPSPIPAPSPSPSAKFHIGDCVRYSVQPTYRPFCTGKGIIVSIVVVNGHNMYIINTENRNKRDCPDQTLVESDLSFCEDN